jgi:hypothetical protein
VIKRNVLTGSRLGPLALILLLCGFLIGTPAIAQHVLYARGAGESIANFNDDRPITLQDGKLYQVVGMRDRTLTINTPAGLYPYTGNNFVVSDGGQYSSLKVSATHEGSKLSSIQGRAYYSSQLHTPQSIGQVYCVVQWTDATDGRVFQTSCQRIGTLNSDSATEPWANHVSLSGGLPTPITADDVKFSFYVWSGSVEVAVESVSADEEEARQKLERKMLRGGNGQ